MFIIGGNQNEQKENVDDDFHNYHFSHNSNGGEFYFIIFYDRYI